MSLDEPVILSCSISGAVANRDQCPAIPYTPEEYAAEARRIVDEGGSIRVGLEDNFYLPDGEMARSNGDLIAKARQLTIDSGRRPATVEEARALLGVPARATV